MGETRVSVNLKESFGWFNKPNDEVLGASQLTYRPKSTRINGYWYMDIPTYMFLGPECIKQSLSRTSSGFGHGTGNISD